MEKLYKSVFIQDKMGVIFVHNNGKSKQNNWRNSSAGFYMTRNVPIFPASAKVSDVRAQIHAGVKSFKTVDYIYVVDSHGFLKGILSYRTLLSASRSALLSSILTNSPLFTITPESSVDYVAHLSSHHAVSSIIVVDKRRRLLGVITSERIAHILHRRHVEALFHRSGVAKEHTFDTVLETPIMRSVKHRILWLFLGMIGGLFAAKIISLFENTLETNLILAAFIPLVVYIADAVGTQLEAFAIRDLAIFQHLSYSRYFFRQLIIVTLISILLAVAAFAFSFIMYGNMSVSFVIALSIIGASLTSVFTGILIPFIFAKISSDPANASGPIGTILQDLVSVCVYFLIAYLIL